MYKTTINLDYGDNYGGGDKIVYSNKRLTIKELKKLTSLQFIAKQVKIQKIKLMKIYDDESKKTKRVPIPGRPGLYTFMSIDVSPEAKERANKLVDDIMRDAEEIGRRRKEQEAYWLEQK